MADINILRTKTTAVVSNPDGDTIYFFEQKGEMHLGSNIWYANQKGVKGDTGASAYEIAVNNGFSGTEAQWIASLKGVKGDKGLQGIQGIPGIKGDAGAQGIQGLKGDKGDTGAQGIQGVPGTKGDKGETGAQGIQGIPGTKGDTGIQGIQGIKGDPGPSGTLDSTATAAQITNAAESLAGKVTVHKIIKTGNYNDLNNKPDIYTKTDANTLFQPKGNYEPAFAKNTAFNKNFGTAAGTVAEGNHTHAANSITTDANNRFVTDTEKAAWNAKATSADIATAKADAISTAALDATTKANNAQSAAIASAKSYADTTFQPKGNYASAADLAQYVPYKDGRNPGIYIHSNVFAWDQLIAAINGVIKINLPLGWAATMLVFEIDFYNYNPNHAGSKLIVSGYCHTSGWRNYKANIVGIFPYSIRLGYDSVNQRCCILLGTINSAWYYPGFAISKVIAMYNSPDKWDTGYSCEVITDESAITSLVTPVTLDYSSFQPKGNYEPTFAKNTAFNKSFGTAAGTVAEGNHTHAASSIITDANNRFVTDAEKAAWNAKATSADIATAKADAISTAALDATTKANNAQSAAIASAKSYADSTFQPKGNYEPAFAKNTAFNKNFGTAAGTVSEGNHTHVASSITTDANNRFVTDAEKAAWNAKATTADIATAKADAVSTAASDATTKANNAQNAAIASAKSYADSIFQPKGNYEPTFAKNTAFNKNFGTTAGTVAEGNHIHNIFLITDNRGEDRLPGYYPDRILSAFFNMSVPTITTWRSGIHVKGWTSGYNAWQLLGPSSTYGSQSEEWYLRLSISDTAWAAVRRIWHSGNFNPGDYIKAADANAAIAVAKAEAINTASGDATVKADAAQSAAIATAKSYADTTFQPKGNYEPAFAKNTAFNNNFGTAAGTVAEGNHTHAASSIATDANNRFVTDAEKASWNAKATTADIATAKADAISTASGDATVKANNAQSAAIAAAAIDATSKANTAEANAKAASVPLKAITGAALGFYYDPLVMTWANAAITGTIALTLPKAVSNGTMCIYEIWLFDYGTNSSNRAKACQLLVSAYFTSLWTVERASVGMIGSAILSAGEIRLGKDAAGMPMILLGSVTRNWAYPKVAIKRAMAGHAGNNLPLTGWSAEIITDESMITVEKTLPINAQNGIDSLFDSANKINAVYLPAVPTTLPPSGAAGGDLSGSYPNPTVTDAAIAGKKPAFTAAAVRTNILSGETFAVILGKIAKWFTDLKVVAFSGSYNDLSDKPTIPAVPASLPANGGNADTVDNKHAADFATAAQGAKADTAVQAATIGGVAATKSGTTLQLPAYPVVPASLPPSGTAGGDLSGSYPNPAIDATKLAAKRVFFSPFSTYVPLASGDTIAELFGKTAKALDSVPAKASALPFFPTLSGAEIFNSGFNFYTVHDDMVYLEIDHTVQINNSMDAAQLYLLLNLPFKLVIQPVQLSLAASKALYLPSNNTGVFACTEMRSLSTDYKMLWLSLNILGYGNTILKGSYITNSAVMNSTTSPVLTLRGGIWGRIIT